MIQRKCFFAINFQLFTVNFQLFFHISHAATA